MNSIFATTLLVLVMACSGVLSETPKEYNCYKCEDNEKCKDLTKNVVNTTEKCTSSTVGCYTIRKQNVTIRGCAYTYYDLYKLTQGGELQGPCKSDLCNKEERPEGYYTCYVCNDQMNCKDLSKNDQVGTQVCSKTDQGCVTAEVSENVQRGCIREQGTIDHLNQTSNSLIEICKTNKCNSEKTYYCYGCHNKDTCTDLSDSQTIPKKVCSMKDAGCLTLRMFDGITLRTCAKNDEFVHDLGLIGQSLGVCKTDLCNREILQKDYYTCYKCSDDKACEDPNVTYSGQKEFCEMSGQGCYTIVKKNKTLRGCAKKEDLESLKKDGELVDSCQKGLCNSRRIYNCYRCNGTAECLHPNSNENSETEKCIDEKNAGCFILRSKDRIIRGCAKNETEIENLKVYGEITLPCTVNKCNGNHTELLKGTKGSGMMISPHFITAIFPVIGALFLVL